MSAIEERLRTELPELATWLTGDRGEDHGNDPADRVVASGSRTAVTSGRVTRGSQSRQRWLLVAAAGLLVAATFGVGALLGDGGRPASELLPAGGAPAGSWTVMAEAPIAPRAHPVTAWIDGELIVWAGSNLQRNHAFIDGAVYDPVSDRWTALPVPGWGHPGLSATDDGRYLYALAKGGGTRYDPETGSWTELPVVEGMYLAATVVADGELWGLGPTSTNPSGQVDLAVARYDQERDRWDYGPVLPGQVDQVVYQGLVSLTQPPLWTGEEILVWAATGPAAAFDPASASWREVPPPEPTEGVLRDSRAVLSDAGLAALVEIDDGADDGTVQLAVAIDGAWEWRVPDLPVADLRDVTVAAAGDWLMVLQPDAPPLTVHVPTGNWRQHDDGPLAGVAAAGTEWTGEHLLIWGGEATPTDSASAPPAGAVWTPPDGARLDG